MATFAAGAFLLLVGAATAPVPAGEAVKDKTITIDATTLTELHGDFSRRMGREPGATEEEGLIRQYADDEILYRHALSLGLDRSDFAVRQRLARSIGFHSETTESDPAEGIPRGRQDESHGHGLGHGLGAADPVLRRLLIENMRVALRYSALDLTPEDVVLQRFVDEHPVDFTAPARVTFVHVFFDESKRGPGLAEDAAAALGKLRAGKVDVADRLGDVFTEGSVIRRRSLDAVARIFGPDFVPAVGRLSPGVWSDPIASVHGLHLVRVETLEPARQFALDEVRTQALARWRAARGDQRLHEEIETLRGQYTVRVQREAAANAA